MGGPSTHRHSPGHELELAFDLAPIGMAVVEVDRLGRGRLARLNAVLLERTGVDPREVAGADVRPWIHPDDFPGHAQRFRQLCTGGLTDTSYEMRFHWPDGSERRGWVRAAGRRGEPVDGNPARVTHVIYHVLDVTDRHDAQQQLERLSLTDPLTSLANRARFEQLTEAALGTGSTVGVMLLDLDRFKGVNDALGHAAGDAVLAEAADRLGRVLPPGTVIARWHGDEFAAMVKGASACGELLDRALAVLHALRQPYVLASGDAVACSASIGVTVSHEGTRAAADLFREADLALYEAKDGGRDRCAVFNRRLRARADARIEQELRLRSALAAGGVRMYLQPVTSLASGRVTGAEALARLEHPRLGTLTPVDFVEVAEDTGLIVDIDARVAELAIAHLADNPADGAPTVAVNVSARSLSSVDYMRRLSVALDKYGVRGDRLLVEVTERSLVGRTGASAAGLETLKRLGVRVGIDDFGTGYSALAYLGRFDLDFLKVDRSFVARLGQDSRSDATVSAIVALAHAHSLVVTAEGVETQAQAAALMAMGCDSGQGWHFGAPAPS